MSYEQIELHIDDLRLDQQNPRLGLSESEALLELFGFNDAHLRNLSRSIAEEGLDPGDSFYVMKSPDDSGFTVLDGNRRLGALLVLVEPGRLENENVSAVTRRSLAALASGFDRSRVEPIRCVLFEDRAAAEPWIRRRHTGEMKGEGRVQWNTLAVQKASGDDTVNEVVDFIRRNAGFREEKWKEFQAALAQGKATTFGRLLESTQGRQFLGISVKKIGPRITPFLEADPKRVRQVLNRIVDDLLAGDTNTRTLHSSKQIDQYFSGLPLELHPADGEKEVHPGRAFKDVNLGSPPKKPPPSKPPVRKKRVPPPRRMLAPPTHEFDTSGSAKFGDLVREASGMNIHKFPLASAFLLRAVVEMTVNRYLGENGLPLGAKGNEFKLSRKADDALKHIVGNRKLRRSELQPFRSRLLGSSSPCSIQSLNGFVHNDHALPTAEHLRVAWEAAVPLFVATYGKA